MRKNKINKIDEQKLFLNVHFVRVSKIIKFPIYAAIYDVHCFLAGRCFLFAVVLNILLCVCSLYLYSVYGIEEIHNSQQPFSSETQFSNFTHFLSNVVAIIHRVDTTKASE